MLAMACGRFLRLSSRISKWLLQEDFSTLLGVRAIQAQNELPPKDEVAGRLTGVGKMNVALLGLKHDVTGGLGCGLEWEE